LPNGTPYRDFTRKDHRRFGDSAGQLDSQRIGFRYGHRRFQTVRHQRRELSRLARICIGILFRFATRRRCGSKLTVVRRFNGPHDSYSFAGGWLDGATILKTGRIYGPTSAAEIGMTESLFGDVMDTRGRSVSFDSDGGGGDSVASSTVNASRSTSVKPSFKR